MIEAMKLALEALEESHPEAYRHVITSLRQAIEQAEKQEPVAWGMQNDDGQIYDCITPEEHARLEGEYKVPLYTTPQPTNKESLTVQREWVGLTEEDKEAIYEEYVSSPQSFMEITEAKLKEKNT